MTDVRPSPPWLAHYGEVPATLDYPAITLYQVLAENAAKHLDAIAWEYFGATATYGELLDAIDRCAHALVQLGVKPGDALLVMLPTFPQAVVAFYAANRLGVRPAMIHPLSTPAEVTHYLDQTGARVAITLDAFYSVLAATQPRLTLTAIVLARLGDHLPWGKRVGFWLTQGYRIAPVPRDPRVHWWHETAAVAPRFTGPPSGSPAGIAAILFSGGTTSQPKGILLSNRAFIAQARQAIVWSRLGKGDSMLAVLPVFHGFGLAVCINATLMGGGRAVLVPQFSAAIVAERLRHAKPTVMVGVPTLFDALTRDRSLESSDLSQLRLCFCGADTLPPEVKLRFEALVARRGGSVKLLEGYGLTEAVSGILGTPLNAPRAGSIGVPFPDVLAKICVPGTAEELSPGIEGEICLAGPTLMEGYLNDPDATREALRTHPDGRVWLHTGDLGRMDGDGYFHFTVRLKRMIKSSGFNVYPAHVEAELRKHAAVADVCVAGVPDTSQGERVVAWVVPAAGVRADDSLAGELIAFSRERLIKWSCPREVRFINALPLTKVGKIDYRALVATVMEKRQGA